MKTQAKSTATRIVDEPTVSITGKRGATSYVEFSDGSRVLTGRRELAEAILRRYNANDDLVDLLRELLDAMEQGAVMARSQIRTGQTVTVRKMILAALAKAEGRPS